LQDGSRTPLIPILDEPMKRILSLFVVLLAANFASAEDWPQWMGPGRDDVWSETGVIEEFPEGGPAVLWRRPISGGFAGPAVVGGKVYVTDYVKSSGDARPAPTKRNDLQGTERVLCLDAKSGEEVWKHEYDCNYSISYPAGPRCTPTVAGGRVYTLGAMGDLFCLDAAKGSVIWSKNLPNTYDAPVPLWGYAGHPLVYKNLLICMAGGEGSAVAALNKETGEEVWTALTTKEIGYSPPTLIEAGGVMQLLIFQGGGLNSLNPETGEVYWSEPLRTEFSMAIMAPRKGGDFLFAGGHNGKSLGLKLDASKPAVTVAWEGSRTVGLAPVSGTPFVESGVAYGIDGSGLFRAMRMATGEHLWSTARPVNGQDSETRSRSREGATFVTKNGDRFFIFGENGDLVIARLSPQGYDEVSRTKLLDPVGVGLGRQVVWSHPAYANKCVFARNDKEIVCASLAATE
jgi:outer membrane protein assembly factor BamB